MLTVQLQDVSGSPARARQLTNIVVTSANKSLFREPMNISVSPGIDFATLQLHSSTFGSTNLTATAAGLTSTSVLLTVLRNPVNFTIFPNPASTLTGVGVQVSVKVFALNHLYKGAHVVWSTKAGTVTPNNSTTDATGTASTVYTNNNAGVESVTALISTPFAGVANLSASVYISAPVTPQKPTFFQTIAPYLWIIIIVVVVVVVVVLYFFWFRKRRKKKAEAGTEEEASQPYDELEEMPTGGAEGETGEGGMPPGEFPPAEGGQGGEETAGGESQQSENAGTPDENI
jgi:hypothetical protein